MQHFKYCKTIYLYTMKNNVISVKRSARESYLCQLSMCFKQKTPFFTDVITFIYAGMQFTYGKNITKSGAMKKIGSQIVRVYFDTKEKDFFVGQENRKRNITC